MKRNRQSLETTLRELEQQHQRRQRRTIEAFPDAGSAINVMVDGRALVNFCSNDYLGLARHPHVAQAMATCATRLGSGSGAAHLVTGHGTEHAALEAELAAFTGRERALLFSTGYMANLAALTTFADRNDMVLLDRLSHASLIDGGLLANARFRRYAHADASAAKCELEAYCGDPTQSPRSAILATDGVFSMDGDLAPLPELAAAAKAHDAWLVVDDAHGLGVMGRTGRGTVEHFGLDAEAVPLLIGTLGKAFGSFGAFIASDRDVIELLIQYARSYIYTTALPQPVAAATRESLKVIEREPWRRERVLSLTQYFRRTAQAAGLPLTASTTPIQPILLGDSAAALTASRKLFDAGFWVAAIRPPTVPSGSARLRVTLSAAHTEAQVDSLVNALAESL